MIELFNLLWLVFIVFGLASYLHGDKVRKLKDEHNEAMTDLHNKLWQARQEEK